MGLFTILEQRQNDVETLYDQLEIYQKSYADQALQIKEQAQISRERFRTYLIGISLAICLFALWTSHLFSLVLVALFWLLNDIDDIIMIFRPGLYRRLNLSEHAWVGRGNEPNKELVSDYENIKSTNEKCDEAVLQRDRAKRDILLLLQQHLPEIDFSKLPPEAQSDLKQYLEMHATRSRELDVDDDSEDEDNGEAVQLAGGEERE